ncbi:MAG: hypothetical protein AAF752_13135 [Bacteroidota bacterium]
MKLSTPRGHSSLDHRDFDLFLSVFDADGVHLQDALCIGQPRPTALRAWALVEPTVLDRTLDRVRRLGRLQPRRLDVEETGSGDVLLRLELSVN